MSTSTAQPVDAAKHRRFASILKAVAESEPTAEWRSSLLAIATHHEHAAAATPMLKYVRLTSATHGECVVFGAAPQSHADLARLCAADGWVPASAGFCHFGPACGITTHGESLSLRLRPAEGDAQRIAAIYRVTGELNALPATF